MNKKTIQKILQKKYLLFKDEHNTETVLNNLYKTSHKLYLAECSDRQDQRNGVGIDLENNDNFKNLVKAVKDNIRKVNEKQEKIKKQINEIKEQETKYFLENKKYKKLFLFFFDYYLKGIKKEYKVIFRGNKKDFTPTIKAIDQKLEYLYKKNKSYDIFHGSIFCVNEKFAQIKSFGDVVKMSGAISLKILNNKLNEIEKQI